MKTKGEYAGFFPSQGTVTWDRLNEFFGGTDEFLDAMAFEAIPEPYLAWILRVINWPSFGCNGYMELRVMRRAERIMDHLYPALFPRRKEGD